MGGATACLRTAEDSERNLPRIPVKLACGSCDLHINDYGTLLSPTPVSPIISVRALLKLGYRIDWNASRCRVYHPTLGELDVDTGTGCPEVDENVALDLIGQYEMYVGHQDIKSARIRCIIEDLRDRGTGELMEIVRKCDTHADAAFSVFVSRMIPDVSPEVCENCVVSLQDGVEETRTWNRRTRRRCLKSQGVVVHAFCGGAKRAFEHVAHKWDFAHLSVDSAEDLLNDSTYIGSCFSRLGMGGFEGWLGVLPVVLSPQPGIFMRVLDRDLDQLECRVDLDQLECRVKASELMGWRISHVRSVLRGIWMIPRFFGL